MDLAKRSAITVFSVAALFSVLQGADNSTLSSVSAPDTAYVRSFEKWKAEQIEDLKKNWLPLAGLYWLKPGANSFGSAAENAVVFPKGPAHAGEFDLEGKDVTIKLLPEVHATSEGKPLAEAAKMDPDVSGHASMVEIGSLEFHVIVRGQLCSAQFSRADVLSVGYELPDRRDVVAVRWKKDDRCAQCPGGCDRDQSGGYSGVQDQRSGSGVDRSPRRSFERTFLR